MNEVDGVEIVLQERGVRAVAIVGHFVVAVGTSNPTLRDIVALGAASDRVIERFPKFGRLIVTNSDLSPPTAEVREALTEAVRRYRGKLSGVAIVLEGRGVRAQLQRGLVAFVTSAARIEHPTRVFQDVGPAAVWLSGQVPVSSGVDGERLRRAVAEVRQATGTQARLPA